MKISFSYLFPFRKRPLSFEAASRSACGFVRQENQDFLMLRRRRHSFCVADGVGGSDGGAIASRIVCAELSMAISRHSGFEERVCACGEAVRRANARIREYATTAGYRRMATTFALLALDPDDSYRGIVGHAGDSRVYLCRRGILSKLTCDHTMASELEQCAGTGALAHVLTRAVGVDNEIQPDWRQIKIRPGDRFLLCSDGVHAMVSEEFLRTALASGGAAHEIVSRIEREVLSLGAKDNYSMIVVSAKEQRRK